MKGLVINGFTVVEPLGSGQGGILYLARDGSGREAVIRVARDGEDNVAIRLFIEEAKQLLPSATDVETSVAPDGRRVLMALAGSTTQPLPQTPASPGGGFTRYAATERLPVASEPPAPATSRTPVMVLLLALVVFGAGAAMIILSIRSAPPASLPPVAQASAPPALDAGAPPAVADAPVAAAVPPPAPEEVVRVATKGPGSAPARAGVRPCTLDARWRKAAEFELLPYEQVAALLGPKQFDEFEKDTEPLFTELQRRVDGEDCRDLDAKFEAVNVKWSRRLDRYRCTPDTKWKAATTARLDSREDLAPSERESVRKEIVEASRWVDCVRLNQRLAQPHP